jgi:hypothetical protein
MAQGMEKEMYTELLWRVGGGLEGMKPPEELDIRGKIILKLILNK